MVIVKRIKKAGYPIFTKSGNHSLKYRKAHSIANKATLKKFGSMTAKAINKISCPHDELLGSHTKKGKIKVSSRVPKHLRRAIYYHEAIEHRMMK